VLEREPERVLEKVGLDSESALDQVLVSVLELGLALDLELALDQEWVLV